MEETQLSNQGKKRMYWVGVGASVREGLVPHRQSGQLQRGSESWRNVTEHCLVQVARVEVLARWIGLPDDMMTDIRMGSFLHDFDKRGEITATKQANESGESPLVAARAEHKKGDNLLNRDGFSARIIRFAGSAGGDAPQLIEAQTILNKPNLSDEDWAYLLVHYVDDCSDGSKWVRKREGDKNIVDYRTDGNKSKSTYTKITKEIEEKLKGSAFDGMDLYDAMALVSHQIERRLAKRIYETTGEIVEPLDIPELIDQKIEQKIEQM